MIEKFKEWNITNENLGFDVDPLKSNIYQDYIYGWVIEIGTNGKRPLYLKEWSGNVVKTVNEAEFAFQIKTEKNMERVVNELRIGQRGSIQFNTPGDNSTIQKVSIKAIEASSLLKPYFALTKGKLGFKLTVIVAANDLDLAKVQQRNPDREIYEYLHEAKKEAKEHLDAGKRALTAYYENLDNLDESKLAVTSKWLKMD